MVNSVQQLQQLNFSGQPIKNQPPLGNYSAAVALHQLRKHTPDVEIHHA